MTESFSPEQSFFVLVVIFCIYFFPGILSWIRKHNNENAIVVFNLFLGWTLLGWVLALVWALTDNVKK